MPLSVTADVCLPGVMDVVLNAQSLAYDVKQAILNIPASLPMRCHLHVKCTDCQKNKHTRAVQFSQPLFAAEQEN